MLTLTLRKLERDGLVIRTAHAEVPPRVECEPSELAATLIPHAVALANWAIEHKPDIDAHREARPEVPARWRGRDARNVGWLGGSGT
jgi:DNA-binding HxlR family transcriptional regulator